MKINKTISIENNLYERLQKEENASNLIEKLLFEYYDKQEVKTLKLSLEQIRERKARIAAEIDVAKAGEIDKLNAAEAEILKITEDEKQEEKEKEQRAEERRIRFKNFVIEQFKATTGRDMLVSEVKEYLQLWDEQRMPLEDYIQKLG